ncbi:alpha/beta hydrolase [Kocuria sp.]|uniref:alpha/beta hydrolase n=1 Tax=Kocuria sp. TaxID=1871328 RepID=UPI0026DF89D1|nr:alpha/beta hydrolase-fold protein [Kocuria sp.]MDO5618550.1 alpha/beta hydrolase-fold protein [Kocuria sp.]
MSARSRQIVLIAVSVAVILLLLALILNWDRVRSYEQQVEEDVVVGPTADSPEPAATAVPPATAPSFGPARVTDQEPLSDRTTLYWLSTPLVTMPESADGPTVMVTLPDGYNPSRHYPVLYLLTGTAEGEAPESWYDEASVEDATTGLDAIVVALDDGWYGWYTDWTVPGDEPQAWRTFHLEQMIPWVDATFPTITSPSGRAVAGASAGGFGAMTYAEVRPDLFGVAASFSGLLSFHIPEERQDVLAEAYEASGSPHALFGDGERTTQADWDAHDPSLHTESLRGKPLWIYSGSGNDYEASLQETSDTFAAAARTSGAHVTERTYAELNNDGAYAPAGICTEGHEWECWSMALYDWTPELQGYFDQR